MNITLTIRLSLWVEDMKIKWLRDRSLYDRCTISCELVGLKYKGQKYDNYPD